LNAILRRAREVPGIESAALSKSVPLSLAGISGIVTADDRVDAKDAGVDADIYEVSPGFSKHSASSSVRARIWGRAIAMSRF
jgi:hypothetical protein